MIVLQTRPKFRLTEDLPTWEVRGIERCKCPKSAACKNKLMYRLMIAARSSMLTGYTAAHARALSQHRSTSCLALCV
eukprot:1356518-Amphidinium_carterae.2